MNGRWAWLLPLAVWLALLSPATGQDAGDLIAPYLRARDGRSVGKVDGQAYADAPRPSAPPVPNADVSVLLLPYSTGFASALDRVKDHYRDSLNRYMGVVADVSAERAAQESALLWAGGGELIRGEVSDEHGAVRLADVPAGEWLLLAWREVRHSGKGGRPDPRDTGAPASTGYAVVTFWRMRLDVRAGEATEVSLTDRNVWLTGIREDVSAPASMPRKDPSKRR